MSEESTCSMEIVRLPKPKLTLTQADDWPTELLFHMERCLRLPVREAFELEEEPKFFEVMKEEAKRDREHFPTLRPIRPPTNYEEIVYEYRSSFCDLEEPTCPLEPTETGGVVHMIKNGDVEGLERRLQTGLDPNGFSVAGIPLLSLAVAHRQVQCVELLLRYEACSSPRNYWSPAGPLDYVMPILLESESPDQRTIIQLLIDAGSRFAYFNVLDSIFLYNEVTLLRKVMQDRSGIFFSPPSNPVLRPIPFRVAKYGKGCEKILDMIVHWKSDVLEEKGSRDYTPLHYAVFNTKDFHMANNLLRYQIDPSVLNHDGISALAIAVHWNKVGAVEAMIGHPKISLPHLHEVVPFSKTPLGRAMETHNYTLMDMLLSDPRMCLSEKAQSTAIYWARALKFDEQWVARIQDLRTST
ncbi:hypothetical protein ASPBRDRAFT_194368 [Aspergillus brasiliensis CBS 101740]|uniref:Uncharacterized protein n=1 Tax=Aspergillus brasiliensis (strain CBS 101740 / IMI 381727 / IBT 21946) TaxID=767769 RepID=A0A1L9UNZ2_ASPBC|nr:hypothetical protein ASPBRDRAFT_194368 [Aspergillus brasiliensis CBS 101740]